MTEKIKKWINSIRWKYFTNQQAGYTQQAVYDELNMYNAIIEERSMVNRKMIDRYLKINNYYAIDKETGLKLGFDDTIKELNRTDFLKKNCRKRNEAMRLVLKEEIANAESDELKNSLNKVLNRRLDL